MANNISILIETVTKGEQQAKNLTNAIQSGFKQGKLAVDAFNAAAGHGQKTLQNMTSGVGDLVKAYVSIAAAQQAFGGMLDILKRGEQAQFALQASVQAANREFKNTGSLEYWESTIKGLSQELQVYSESSLRNAVSRTVDMTKRLGLGADQMTEVIRRTADLSAGKIELEDGVERVTAALRGEAEASEYLGLTLNETYVKGWHEAHNAMGKAWKDLTDMEKAQVRYNVFLEQTAATQGRATESAKTFGGALQLIQTAIDNAVTNNEDLAQAMSKVAKFIRENADEIGKMASELIELTARVVEFTIEWKDELKLLAEAYLAGKAVGFLKDMVGGLGSALNVLKSIGGPAIIGGIGSALGGLALNPIVLTLAASLGVLAGAIYLDHKASEELLETWEKLQKAGTDLKKINTDFADSLAKDLGTQLGITIKDYQAFVKLQESGEIVFDKTSRTWTLASQKLRDQAEAARFTGEQLEKLEQTVKDVGEGYKTFSSRIGNAFDFAAGKAEAYAKDEQAAAAAALQVYAGKAQAILQIAEGEAQQKLEILRRSGASEKQQAELSKQIAIELKNARITALENYRGKIGETLLQAIGKERAYADQVKAFQRERVNLQASTEEMIRGLRRQTMTDEQAWLDRRKEAYESLRKAQSALATAESADDLEKARQLAEKAQQQFNSLAGEVKKGEQVVISEAKSIEEATKGVTRTGQVLNDIVRAQEAAAQKNQKTWQDTIKELQTAFDALGKKVEQLDQTEITPEARIEVDSSAVDNKLRELDGKVTTSTHIIYEQTVQQSATGGPIGFAQGGWNRLRGKLSGYGGGDRIRALLEAGEFVVRKEAVAKYGAGLFHALNAMRINAAEAFAGALSSVPKLASGGHVQSYGTLQLQAGGVSLPVQVSGPRGREMVREFEAALKKERLVKGK